MAKTEKVHGNGVNILVLFQGWVQCFSMQVEMKKCFLIPEIKFGADRSCRFREKTKQTYTLIPKNDVTEPKAITS